MGSPRISALSHFIISFQAILLVVALATFSPDLVTGQNCQCTSDLCCSQFGYCGTGTDYCGVGCQQGPCESTPMVSPIYGTAPATGIVSAPVTNDFFDGIVNPADGCIGTGFYTYSSFLDAAAWFSLFGNDNTSDDNNKREIAAFFAHAAHETGQFCYIEEIGGASRNYCDDTNTKYPCAAGKLYHGRGPLQLSWNYNYGAAGQSLGFDGLGSPETVSKDPTVSFKVALWFWMTYVHSSMISGGFGATIGAINGALECNGNNPDEMNDRVWNYINYCKMLGVGQGDNVTC